MYRMPLGRRYPSLFQALMSQRNRSLAAVIETFESVGSPLLEDRTEAGNAAWIRHAGSLGTTGYRNTGVNLCRAIPGIRCCLDCPHNDRPRHGGIEFRAFPGDYDVREAVTLAQRIVALVCDDTRPDEDMRSLARSSSGGGLLGPRQQC